MEEAMTHTAQQALWTVEWYLKREPQTAGIRACRDIVSRLLRVQPMPSPNPKPKTMAKALVDIVENEIGVEEVNGTNTGRRVNEYKAATWLDPEKGWPWCAAFVCWAVREAMAATGLEESDTFKRPRTAGAWDLANWSTAQDNTVRTRRKPDDDIQPGDIIGYTFSHCGIAVTSPDAGGRFYAVEGNTDHSGSREGGGVFRKLRPVGKVRFRIRFA